MQSGTGVYYQAIPAVGPDGKNVMTLIPVKKVNGQFVPMQVLSQKNDHQPAHTSPVSLPHHGLQTLQPLADGRFILQTPIDSNTLFTSVKSQHQGTNTVLINTANQVHAPVVAQRMAQNVVQSSVQKKIITVTNSSQIPNTVKSPVFPSGHYLQIPSNATVKTLPASALPPSIKNRICNTANASSNPVKGLPMVLYVSPVNSLKLNQQMPCVTSQTEIPLTLGSAPTTSSGDATIPKPNQEASTTIKWVIQERTGNSAPYLIPVTSSSMSSDILKAVKLMESEKNHQGAKVELTSADSNQEKVAPGKDNALVMCNGKVFFVAKKNSEVTKDVTTNAESKPQYRKPFQTPPTKTFQNQKQDTSSVSSKESSDVIDLCGEDEESSVCKRSVQLPSETPNETEEDSNVIFVSYIPPKPSENDISEGRTEMVSQSGEKELDSSIISTQKMDKGSDINSGSSTDFDVSQCETKEAALDKKEARLEEPEVACHQGSCVSEKMIEKTNLDQLQQLKSDSKIRQTFGIVSDLRVSLLKMNVSTKLHPQEEKHFVNKRTLEGIRKLIQDSKVEAKIKRLIQEQVPNPSQEETNGLKDWKRPRFEQDEERRDSDTWDIPRSIDTAESEMPSLIAEQCTDSSTLQTGHRPEEAASSSASEPAQTCTALSHNTPSCSGLRKPPPRQTKGTGRMCTACPCGTKVGRVAPSLDSKPQEKPDLATNVDVSSNVSSRLSRGPMPDVANSVSNSLDFKDISKKDMVQSNHTHSRNVVKYPLQTATSPTSQPQDDGLLTTKEKCDRSKDLSQVKTLESGSGSQQTQTPNLNEVDVSVPSSSAKQCGYQQGYQIPIELYSSVVLDPEEIKRQERIKRLKDLLREKEAALEKLRKNM